MNRYICFSFLFCESQQNIFQPLLFLLFCLEMSKKAQKAAQKAEKSKEEGPDLDFLRVLEEKQELNPSQTIREISQIFGNFGNDNQIQGGNKQQFSPQARIILLTILLMSTVLGMYTIFESFLDTIILAVLSGIAYVRIQEKFVQFLRRQDIEAVHSKSLATIIVECIYYLLIIIMIPWIRQEFSDETCYDTWSELLEAKFNNDTIESILQAFPRSNNIIKLTQIYFTCKIVINLCGNMILRVFYTSIRFLGRLLFDGGDKNKGARRNSRINKKINHFIHKIFFVLFLITMILLVVVTAGIFFEFGSIIGSAGRAIEKHNNCTFYNLEDNSTDLPQCTDVITGTLKPYLPNIQEQKEVTKCIQYIEQTEERYLSSSTLKLDFTLLQHKKQICLVYQILKEYSPAVIDHFFDIQVTKQYLLTIFRNLFSLLFITSDTIFSITTFISIFMVSVRSYTAADDNFSLFGQYQNELISDITNLMSDYIMVTIKHILFSLALFEIFRFSEFNIVLSLLIGTITLFPLISTNFIMVIFALAKYYGTSDSNHLANLSAGVCFALFYLGSGAIFQNHFNKVNFNNTLIGLSAVFGLYRFPVAGVFYGPMVILLFRCAYEALGRSKV